MTEIPAPYPGEFVRVVIGSTIHGLGVPDTDDLDLMGICIEPPEDVLGMSRPFEQHTWRTQPEGHPSGPGDVDLSVYSLCKWLRLASNGNPTVINLLFVAPEFRHLDGRVADDLRAMTSAIVSREAGNRYLGYMRAQRERLLGLRGQKHTGYTRRLKYSVGGWLGHEVRHAPVSSGGSRDRTSADGPNHLPCPRTRPNDAHGDSPRPTLTA